MTTWGVTRSLAAAAAVLALAACTGDDGTASSTTTAPSATASTTTTTTAPERPASTTTTAFDPATVEGEVEAAYLRSWDVYADAVYHLDLDEPALASAFTGDALELRTKEIERRITRSEASNVVIDHDYEVLVASADSANVIDNFVNHQRRIDPTTKEPVESDPNELLLVNFRMDRTPDGWRVAFIQKVSQ